MKKQVAELSKSEREKVESEYHSQGPEEFNKLMVRAKSHAATAVDRSTARSKSKRKVTQKKRAA